MFLQQILSAVGISIASSTSLKLPWRPAMYHNIAVFGEAEKGAFQTAYFCQSLSQLLDTFGQPPKDSEGINTATYLILNNYRVIFFRVREEGYSTEDYLDGLVFLKKYTGIQHLSGICLPGVSSPEIYSATQMISHIYLAPIMMMESDLYDYMTDTMIAQ